MLYSEILDALYNQEIHDVVEILNMSVYSTNLNKLNDELFIIHTGFSFMTHKGTEMELYAGFSTNSNKIMIIRQSRANWSYKWVPSINGIFVKITAKNYYLNEIDNKICRSIEEIDDDYQLQSIEFENTDEILNLDMDKLTEELGLFKINTKQGVLTFPWCKKLTQRIYLNGVQFSEVRPPSTNDDRDVDRRQSFDEHLRNDYGDDAETAYWNID